LQSSGWFPSVVSRAGDRAPPVRSAGDAGYSRPAIRIADAFEELLAEEGIMVPSKDREGGEEKACLYPSPSMAVLTLVRQHH
jgi:hypothetical protein